MSMKTPIPFLLPLLACLLGVTRAATIEDRAEYQACQANPSTCEELSIRFDRSLTSTIPTEIGRLTALTNLRLYENALTGTIPTEIGRLTRLEMLELEDNALTGTVPTEIRLLTAMTRLSISSNAGLCGPCEFCGRGNYETFFVNLESSIGIGTNIGSDCPKTTTTTPTAVPPTSGSGGLVLPKIGAAIGGVVVIVVLMVW